MSPERTGDWAQTKKPTRVKKCFYIRLPPRSAGCVCAQGRFRFRSMGQVIGVWPTLTDEKERKKLPLQKKRVCHTCTCLHKTACTSRSSRWFISLVDNLGFWTEMLSTFTLCTVQRKHQHTYRSQTQGGAKVHKHTQIGGVTSVCFASQKK